ncbi:hypothetical protein [Flavobacterium terrigena]|uniref:Uncharacterized protein n=1 Tax=Flavobacterium terrigena TaxID=402734 RepID=A0A1H6QCN6_9FLAO|nr:hypothetical protein [Flavobacterium terrigena]SEI41498.1 hypothetical protein SAMN05660918_0437 [Flavobacterium terrigena]
MKNEISQKVNWGILFPLLIILLGAILLIYMIAVEDEPGALPLILIIVGIVLLTKNWFKINRNNSSNK